MYTSICWYLRVLLAAQWVFLIYPKYFDFLISYHSPPFATWEIFQAFLSSAVCFLFFKINFCKKFFQQYHLSLKHNGSRLDFLSGLIWVQSVCKGHQQTIVARVNKKPPMHFFRKCFGYVLVSVSDQHISPKHQKVNWWCIDSALDVFWLISFSYER